jgi:hypothetical protein
MANATFAQVSLGSSKVPLCNQLLLQTPTCSPIPLPWDKKHCSLVVLSWGGFSYLIIATKLMQNWGYVYLVLLDFTDNVLFGVDRSLSNLLRNNTDNFLTFFYPLNIVVMCNNCTVIYSLMPWWFYITQYLELSWWGFCIMYEVWFSILFYFHGIGHSTSLSNIADKTGTCGTCIKTWKNSDAFVSNKRKVWKWQIDNVHEHSNVGKLDAEHGNLTKSPKFLVSPRK